MPYQYSPLKVIHFDFTSPEFITFWSNKDRHVQLKATAHYDLEKIIAKPKEYKIIIEWRCRFFNDKKEQVGSFITSAYYLTTYSTDLQAHTDVNNIFSDSAFRTKSTLVDLLTTNHLAVADVGELPIQHSVISELISQLRANSLNG